MRLSMWWKESRSAQMFRRTVRILKFHLLAQAETASDLMARWYVRNGHRVWRVDGQVWTTAPGGWAPEFCTSRELDGTETTWRLAARGPQSRRQAIRTPSGDLLLDDFAAHVRQHMTLALPSKTPAALAKHHPPAIAPVPHTPQPWRPACLSLPLSQHQRPVPQKWQIQQTVQRLGKGS